jgi:hypothetical protein
MPDTDDKLSWALFYAREMGIPVLPLYETDGERCSCDNAGCTNQGKHPRTKNGLKDATRNEERIREWWTRWPNANVAGRMGTASGTIALDCDTPEAVAFVEQHAPDAPFQTTGSGGRQFFFLHEEGLKNWRGIRGGMDVRTDNSYVVLPPSSNKNGPYSWTPGSERRPLPEELRKVVLEHKEQQARIAASTAEKVRDALGGASPSWDSVKDVLDTVGGRFSAEEFIPEGTRHDRLLELGGSLRGRGVPEGKIVLALRWINENLCRPPLDDWDLAGIVDYVKKIKREVNDLVDDFEAWLETQPFKGKAGATDKKVVKTLLQESRKYGKRGLRGLDVVVSRLGLKDKVGVGYKTVCASIKRIPFVESTRDRSSITNASTLTVLYPNGAEVNEDGELVVVPFVRQGDNSYIEENHKKEEYREVNSDCPLGVRSRWGKGRLGFTKEDFLNLILDNIAVGVPFTIGDLHFVNRDHNFKRRHLSDLAKPEWGFLKRVKRGVYVVPEDVARSTSVTRGGPGRRRRRRGSWPRPRTGGRPSATSSRWMRP